MKLVSVLLLVLHITDAFSASPPSDRPIPITVISGFLGSGKTTLLQHVLQNNDGLKIAVIVNDVASVNIDQKLVVGGTASSSDDPHQLGAGANKVLQLSNGCACCSLSEELMASVSELITLSDMRAPDEKFDHIIIETSGVSNPRAIRTQFQDAAYYNMPLMERVRLDTMVTLIDATTFLDYLGSSKDATEDHSPELFFRSEEERLAEEEARKSDNLMQSIDGIADALRAQANGTGSATSIDASEMAGSGVSALLMEQTEVSDVLLLNKVDILEEEEGAETRLKDLQGVVSSLNPRATVVKTKFSAVDSWDQVLAVANGEGVATAGVVDDHRDFVAAVGEKDGGGLEQSHDHDHGHSHSHENDHGHERDNDHAHEEEKCEDPKTCDDPSHSYSIGHDHDASTCTDDSHSHSHSHSHDKDDKDDNDASTCDDPTCTDPSHSHSHSHGHGNELYSGIGSFVYRARRPFHPGRLTAFLRYLPISRGIPDAEEGHGLPFVPSSAAQDALRCIIRSKGFAWLGDSNVAALYWSHAGASFDMQCLGRWWATLSRDQWPEEAVDTILSDFDDVEHVEEGNALETVGDRRQEVVFIGPNLSDSGAQDSICETLNSCLLSDEEWESYKKNCTKDASLRSLFTNPLTARMMTL